ncbi:SCAN domain-containing protein 3-like [Anthonomus grandis grandis]|uniref:SCAN domain-containing protein 3-like n=1 Tax=Anthonomus grandis grandis TaxID=2921223 RepID=UPI002166A549|nr:SCAN domain-containing protein 3-like [Anthonomus grandis grandis]
MDSELKRKYCNITRQIIEVYLLLCKECQLKKKVQRKGLVVKPILTNEMNSRCQVDLIDMQSEPDQDFRFILNYQDHLTKFTVLRALKTKTAEEVAYHLLDIFCLFGAPMILQSDNGREFENRIVENLAEMWPGLKLVHGKPRHSQSQGSVERSNQDVRDMLVTWLADQNTTKWSEGLRFMQSNKNRSLHTGLTKSPYEAMFGTPQKIGLKDSSLPKELLSNIKTEEELQKLCNQENSDEREDGHLRLVDDDNLINRRDTEDKQQQQQEKNVCTICEKEMSDSLRCSVCCLSIHIICGKAKKGNGGGEQSIICNRCLRNENISNVRVEAKGGLEKQAEKMIALSNSKLPPIDVGKTVIIRVPDVDRGRLAPRNVLAVVLSINDSGLYQLGTKDGTLQSLYSRNEFTLADSDFIDISTVPSTSVSLRTASGLASGSKQGFIQCNCKRYCIDRKCACRAKKVVCNSKCHRNSSCKNK